LRRQSGNGYDFERWHIAMTTPLIIQRTGAPRLVRKRIDDFNAAFDGTRMHFARQP
jgi:hypothetical protein